MYRPLYGGFLHGGDERTGAPPFDGTAENTFSWRRAGCEKLDENEVLLVTVCGVLTIRGKELHVGRLELEKGEADIEGSIDSLVYTEHGPLQKKGSALARLFR